MVRDFDFRTWESLVQRAGIAASQSARLMRALVEETLRPRREALRTVIVAVESTAFVQSLTQPLSA